MSNLDASNPPAKPKFKLEVISRLPAKPRLAPPLLFVHGTWHAAWCWNEFFLGYFADQGFAVHAMSLRGHGASEGPRRMGLVRMRDYVDDLAQTVASLPTPPILIGHSMGGYIIQKYLEGRSSPLGVLLASAPPKGGMAMFYRLAMSRPLDVLKANLSFSVWPIVSDLNKASSLLFSPSLPAERASRYHQQLQDDSMLAYLDLLLLDPVAVDRISTPMVVMGGRNDLVVTAREQALTAKAYRTQPIVLDGLAHDLMLDTEWQVAADRVLRELDARISGGAIKADALVAAA